eukprot:6482315-Pyramimonas_sp.AAC.1
MVGAKRSAVLKKSGEKVLPSSTPTMVCMPSRNGAGICSCIPVEPPPPVYAGGVSIGPRPSASIVSYHPCWVNWVLFVKT